MKKTLDLALKEYTAKDYYPFHMPGHKRSGLSLGEPSFLDITEIAGFDDLHHPEGLILEAEKEAARLWKAKRSFLLVNGSTCGILAAVTAVFSKGDHVLVADNVHKSVRHAVSLNELQAVPVSPVKTAFGVEGQIRPEDVKAAWKKEPKIRGMVLTSPTYEGITSDIVSIAEIVHDHGGILVVDEAHGAHFGFHPLLPPSAVTLGADLVVQSLHKTLPSLTQTAVLHVASDLVPEDALLQCLDVFETSSPSYVLMAGMSRCIRLLTEEREPLFDNYMKELGKWYESNRDYRHLSVLTGSRLSPEEAYAFDPGKLVLRSDIPEAGGRALAACLREVYHLEMERSYADIVIGMTSICDRREGFLRLTEALHEIDENPDLCREYKARDTEPAYDIYKGCFS